MKPAKLRLILAVLLFIVSMILLYVAFRPNPRTIQTIPMPTVEIQFQE